MKRKFLVALHKEFDQRHPVWLASDEDYIEDMNPIILEELKEEKT